MKSKLITPPTPLRPVGQLILIIDLRDQIAAVRIRARLTRVPGGECGAWSVFSKPQPDTLQLDIVSQNWAEADPPSASLADGWSVSISTFCLT